MAIASPHRRAEGKHTLPLPLTAGDEDALSSPPARPPAAEWELERQHQDGE